MTEEFSEGKDESLGQSIPDEVDEDQTQIENGSVDAVVTEEVSDALTECNQELAAEKDQRLRIAAEFANYRRRIEGQRVEWSLRAQAGVIRALLPVLDDLERSLSVAKKTASEDRAFCSLQSGINLVHDNFVSELEKLGLKRIQTVGAEFDEHLHEAVGQVPAPEGEADGCVLSESQAGYQLKDHVIRHAKVLVAMTPETSISIEPEHHE